MSADVLDCKYTRHNFAITFFGSKQYRTLRKSFNCPIIYREREQIFIREPQPENFNLHIFPFLFLLSDNLTSIKHRLHRHQLGIRCHGNFPHLWGFPPARLFHSQFYGVELSCAMSQPGKDLLCSAGKVRLPCLRAG